VVDLGSVLAGDYRMVVSFDLGNQPGGLGKVFKERLPREAWHQEVACSVVIGTPEEAAEQGAADRRALEGAMDEMLARWEAFKEKRRVIEQGKEPFEAKGWFALADGAYAAFGKGKALFPKYQDRYWVEGQKILMAAKELDLMAKELVRQECGRYGVAPRPEDQGLTPFYGGEVFVLGLQAELAARLRPDKGFSKEVLEEAMEELSGLFDEVVKGYEEAMGQELWTVASWEEWSMGWKERRGPLSRRLRLYQGSTVLRGKEWVLEELSGITEDLWALWQRGLYDCYEKFKTPKEKRYDLGIDPDRMVEQHIEALKARAGAFKDRVDEDPVLGAGKEEAGG
jgi:hypothetical protein